MRTITWVTSFQIALRNCPNEARGMVSINVIVVKREYLQSSTYFSQKLSASL